MEVVLVCGESETKEEKFAVALRSELSRLLSKNNPFDPLGGLCIITSRQYVSPGNPVIVFSGKPKKAPVGGRLAILEEGNMEAVSVLSGMGIEAIPCGMNEKNTLTISSSDLDKVQVCLQRSVSSLNGQSIDPAEYPFEAGKENGFPFLAAAALCILAAGPS